MKALVLGGGGITGVGWMFGVLAGLAEAGLDLSRGQPPDLVVGTSAGSVVGAQVASGVDLEEAYARQLAAPSREIGAGFGLGMIARYAWAGIRSRSVDQLARRIGQLALAAKTVPEAERRAVIASRLPVQQWPERRLLLTAADAESGERKVFDRKSGAELVDAVAASCAVPGVWPTVTIGGRRYMDGGVRSGTHLDLATGAKVVLALVPLPRTLGPVPPLASQVQTLERGGSAALVVSPDAAALRAIGRNVLDPAKRAGAAKAGRAQAVAITEHVKQLWMSAPHS